MFLYKEPQNKFPVFLHTHAKVILTPSYCQKTQIKIVKLCISIFFFSLTPENLKPNLTAISLVLLNPKYIIYLIRVQKTFYF